MALDSLDYIPELCRQFATGNCYLGPFCKYRHRVFLERLSDYAQICELNNCTRPECTNLHITKQEENLFRNEEVIPSKLVCRYTTMLSFLINEFGMEYVEAQTSLFEILSTVPPPERGQLLEHVMECLLQCSPPAQPPSPHRSPTTNTGSQQPAMTPVGAIQPQYPFPPPKLSGDMDTAVTQAPPYTPSSTCLGPMEWKRCKEEIKPQIPARTVVQTSHVRTHTNEARALLLAPPPSSSPLLLTSSTRTSYFEPGDNKRRKIVEDSPIADAPRSSAVSVTREPPTAPSPQSLTTNTPFSNKTSKGSDLVATDNTQRKPPAISSRRPTITTGPREPPTAPPPQSFTTNTPFSNKKSKGSDLVATDVPMKTQRKPPAISSRRPSVATGPREPPTAPSPQSLTVNTMATKKVSKCFDLVTTELKTNQKPTTISPRRSSAVTVPRELPIGPSSPQSLTTNTMISKKTSKGYDLVITEGKTNQNPPTINSQRASVMNIPRESPASASPPSSPQQLSTNTMIFNKMTSFSSDPSSVAEIKTEPKSPTTLLPPLLAPQSLTVTTNSSNSSCIDTEIDADPRLSPYMILEELRGALQLPPPPPPPPLPAPQSLTVTTNSTGSSFIDIKTELKSTTDSPRSPSMSIPRASPLVFPQVAPPPPPPPSPPPTSLSQSLMTTFNSPDLSLIE
ncbi:proteoglycan 4 [Spodoptera frugiperda]|uniref:Proteoglycan 4 n=1 Tax=Spodoptera frugiperda TaxID=7108 RepID=A0A9R0EDT0_SPOFR|nr:proteoglycan 4 [Spodoptera frugiperda]